MAGYTYTSYVEAVRTMIVSQAPDVAFDTILPSGIDYAEQRIYRELNLISTVLTDTSQALTAGQRQSQIPQTFVTVTNINVLTPAGSTPDAGVRNPLTPVSRDVLDNMWPSNALATRALPTMFAMIDQWSILVGPSPDAGYGLEIVGTERPDALSATNTTTFLSIYLPDLFLAASMVFFSGYMRNFGAQASDPAMSSSWETQYQALKASADAEELRKRFWASSWSSQPSSPQAQPTRG